MSVALLPRLLNIKNPITNFINKKRDESQLGGLAAGAYGVKKAAEKLGTMSGTPKEPKKKKDGLIKKLKDRRDATNKAIEQM